MPPVIRVHAVIDSLTWGGAELLLADFAAGAPAAGLDVSVTYLKDVDGSPAARGLRARGVEPALVPMTRLVNPAGFRRLRSHLGRARPDIVHTHLGYADLLGGVAARSLGIPSVSTLHVMEWPGGRAERARQRLMALARRGSGKVVAVSDRGREAYLAQGWDRPHRVVTVHNGIAAEAAAGEGPAVRAELGLDSGDVVVAMLTVLREGKGHDVAAAAVERLLPAVPGLRLLVLGDGPARPAVERAVAPLGDRAVLTGHRDDVMRILDAVDVVLHPTRVDALPTALIQAMAAGVPSVATAVGGIPELVWDGVNGALVEPPPTAERVAAALAPLVQDVALRRSLGAAGRARFERELSAERWALRLRALYEEVLGTSETVR